MPITLINTRCVFSLETCELSHLVTVLEERSWWMIDDQWLRLRQPPPEEGANIKWWWWANTQLNLGVSTFLGTLVGAQHSQHSVIASSNHSIGHLSHCDQATNGKIERSKQKQWYEFILQLDCNRSWHWKNSQFYILCIPWCHILFNQNHQQMS